MNTAAVTQEHHPILDKSNKPTATQTRQIEVEVFTKRRVAPMNNVHIAPNKLSMAAISGRLEVHVNCVKLVEVHPKCKEDHL